MLGSVEHVLDHGVYELRPSFETRRCEDGHILEVVRNAVGCCRFEHLTPAQPSPFLLWEHQPASRWQSQARVAI
jgi:hypothetical protein